MNDVIMGTIHTPGKDLTISRKGDAWKENGNIALIFSYFVVLHQYCNSVYGASTILIWTELKRVFCIPSFKVQKFLFL